MTMVREQIAMMIVSPQLTRPPSGMGRGFRRDPIRGAPTAGVLTSVAI
jgi:hypothetical protein